jgi:hypothetical protein
VRSIFYPGKLAVQHHHTSEETLWGCQPVRSNHFSEVYLFPEKSVGSFFSFQYLCRPEKIDHLRFFMIILHLIPEGNKRGNEKTTRNGVGREEGREILRKPVN